jgi:hypothetical protein
MLTFCSGFHNPKSGEDYNPEDKADSADFAVEWGGYYIDSFTRLIMRNTQAPAWIMVTLREAAWAPLGVFIFYLIAKSLRLFLVFPPLDIPTHFLGAVAITYFYRVAIQYAQNLVGEIPLPVQVLLGFTCAGTTTILWELYEYVSDLFFQTQMVRGVTDTTVDFFVGLLGALVLSLFYRRRA